ncbi:hypothetical protein M8J77_020193 [Diaphorina citri]|nr:hypothetical protein M8J77_020193 [Diaphorina citri]
MTQDIAVTLHLTRDLGESEDLASSCIRERLVKLVEPRQNIFDARVKQTLSREKKMSTSHYEKQYIC